MQVFPTTPSTQASPVPTGTQDGPSGHHRNGTTLSDNGPESFTHLISQLAVASSTTPEMSEKLSSFAALYSSMQAEPQESIDEEDELDFQTICSILDERHVLRDCVTLDGQYGDFLDPFAFAAGSKGNNPDVLSRSAMLRATDRDEFLKVEVGEIEGLHDFDVFEYFPINSIPDDNRRKLLNAIWSYRRKRRPDGSLLKYRGRICADGSHQRYGVDFFSSEIYTMLSPNSVSIRLPPNSTNMILQPSPCSSPIY